MSICDVPITTFMDLGVWALFTLVGYVLANALHRDWDLEKLAYQEGYDEGHSEGYDEGLYNRWYEWKGR